MSKSCIYTKCPKPSRPALAIKGPLTNSRRFYNRLGEHHLYWSGQEHNIELASHAALVPLATELHRELFEVSVLLHPDMKAMRSKKLLERDRRRALGTLGVSILLQQLIDPEREYDSAEDFGLDAIDHNALVIDMMGGPDGMPLEHRVHVTFSDAEELLGEWPKDPGVQWYKSETLYLRRQSPADPTQQILDKFSGKLAINYLGMETLFPYLPN